MISVVIPTLNAEASLVRTLGGLVPGVVEGLIRDVIIVDEGSEDATLEIAESTGCQIIHCDASHGLQLWQGCKAARGDWLMILRPESVLSEGWMDAVRLHMKNHPLRAGYFRLVFEEGSGLATLWADWVAFRARFFALPGGDHGLFLSRALYDSVGGYKDQVAFEDISLVMALGRTRLKLLPAALMTGTERFRDKHWFIDQIAKAFQFGLYLLGVPPKPPVRGPRDPGRTKA